MAQAQLSEDDAALIGHIGAVLYREGPRRRMGLQPGELTEEQRNLYSLAIEAVEPPSHSTDMARHQLKTLSALSGDAVLGHMVELVVRACEEAPHDPFTPLLAGLHSAARVDALVEYCRLRLRTSER